VSRSWLATEVVDIDSTSDQMKILDGFQAMLAIVAESIADALRSNRDLPPDLDKLIVRQFQEIAEARRIALHQGEGHFLPEWQPQAIAARNNGFVADIIGYIVKIDVAAQRSALSRSRVLLVNRERARRPHGGKSTT
jgi:hypothetical protein